MAKRKSSNKLSTASTMVLLAKLTSQFGEILSEARKESWRRLGTKYDLTKEDLAVLTGIYDSNDGQHASALAAMIGRAATSFTPNLNRLEKANLTGREADPLDQRAVRIRLQEEGLEIKDILQDIDKLVRQSLIENIGEKELLFLYRIAQTLEEQDLKL